VSALIFEAVAIFPAAVSEGANVRSSSAHVKLMDTTCRYSLYAIFDTPKLLIIDWEAHHNRGMAVILVPEIVSNPSTLIIKYRWLLLKLFSPMPPVFWTSPYLPRVALSHVSKQIDQQH
jgi:hypothetical protein